jgi:hypothetical protein
MNITTRSARILDRRTPAENRSALTLEAFKREFSEYTRYVISAMKQIDDIYTKKLIEQGDRVENQLQKGLQAEYPGLEFRRQGSVSNNTHIQYASDVDVLVLIDKFSFVEHPMEPSIPYKGDPDRDLLDLRALCVEHLTKVFPQVDLDDSGGNSIVLEGGSLYCKVDVVPASWLNTVKYKETNIEHYRGVQILHKKEKTHNKNYPFLYNHLLNINDQERQGLTRMMIRLLKTLKADAIDEGTEIDFSSYDIASLVYRMPVSYLPTYINQPITILNNLLLWLYEVIQNEQIQKELKVIDESRIIFDKSYKKTGLITLCKELYEVYENVKKENPYGQLVTERHL